MVVTFEEQASTACDLLEQVMSGLSCEGLDEEFREQIGFWIDRDSEDDYAFSISNKPSVYAITYDAWLGHAEWVAESHLNVVKTWIAVLVRLLENIENIMRDYDLTYERSMHSHQMGGALRNLLLNVHDVVNNLEEIEGYAR